MVEVITFQNALALSERYSKRHVLLGNGFSIACKPSIFTYGSLQERANLAARYPRIAAAFTALGTSDFEFVIKHLQISSQLLQLYDPSQAQLAAQMLQDAITLKDILVQTIAGQHPSLPHEISDAQYVACRQFLSHFNCIFTLSYDLLLYWALMHEEPNEEDRPKLSTNDGFTKPDDDYDAPYVVWDGEGAQGGHGQNVYYIHGALHLFDAGNELQKYTWSNTGVPLIEQIRAALSRDIFPLFVAEGERKQKLERIKHSAYLHKGFKSFSNIDYALFVYGHSLADNDGHILNKILKGKVKHLFVSLYGDPNSQANQQIIAAAEGIKRNRAPSKPLQLTFFDASSASVWG